MPRLAYLKTFFLVQRVSFTPGSQVLSAGPSEPCRCKTKGSPAGMTMLRSPDTSKGAGAHRGCPEAAPPALCTHRASHNKGRQDSQGHCTHGVVKDSHSLPMEPGGNFSLNTIYSKHAFSKDRVSLFYEGEQAAGDGS